MYKGKFVLKNLTEEELKDFLVEIGEKKFRGSQIYSWIYRNIRDFDEMNNIPKSLRTKLQEHAVIGNAFFKKTFIGLIFQEYIFLF